MAHAILANVSFVLFTIAFGIAYGATLNKIFGPLH